MNKKEILEELCGCSEKSAKLLEEICEKVTNQEQKSDLLRIADSIHQQKSQLEEIKENCND